MKRSYILMLLCICAISLHVQDIYSIFDVRQLSENNTDDESEWYLLGRKQFENGDFQEALRSFNHATQLNHNYLPAYYSKIQILLLLDQPEAALRVSDSTLNIAETAMGYFLQGEVHSKLKSWQKASWAYQSATKIDRGFIEAYIALANIAANNNKAMETLEAADAALGIDPDSKEALIARSKGFALMNNYNYAIDDISSAIQLDPENVEALYLRGKYYNKLNKPQDAVKDFDMALKLQPDHWQAIAGRADACAQSGNKNAAQEGYYILMSIAENYPEKNDIIKYAEKQIFELNRENRPPVITHYNPIPNEHDIVVPVNMQSLTITGKITDESPIKFLKINGQNIAVTHISGEENEFATVVKLENITVIKFDISDVYDNLTKIEYNLIKQ